MEPKRTWLIEMRKQRKLSTYEVSGMAKISQTHYSDIENGKRSPSIPVAKRIANVLFFPWTDFFRDAA